MVSLVAPAASKPTTKPVLRPTPSIKVRKIDDTDFDSEITTTSPPYKKARVTFAPEVEEEVLVEYVAKGRSLDVIRAEVRKAIDGYARGDSEDYNSIKEVFAPRKDDDDEDEEQDGQTRADIKNYVVALTTFSSHLNKNCSVLVKAVLNCEWTGRDKGFVKAYVHFLGSLATTQGAYMGMVLGMLIRNFCGVRLSSGRLAGYPDVNRDQLSSRVHSALKYLLRLIPSASGMLSPILTNKFPDSEDSTKVHISFIENLIRLTEYAPELKSDIFALITDKLVKIDVEMQIRLDDLDDEVGVAVVEALEANTQGGVHGEDSDSDTDSVTSDDDTPDNAKRVKEVQVNIEKMDAILDLLFNLYSKSFTDPNSIEAAAMFETLLSHFANIILPTYRSRHTQFLLFHFAQTADHLVDQFAGTCVQLAFESGRPAVLKQSAAAYLASFVARGAHVEAHVVRTVFELIGNNLEHTRAENELTCRGPDLMRYGTFYAMTQALLYIFCFRWRDLIVSTEFLEDDDPIAFLGQDLDWTPGIKEIFHNVIYSKLNPLKVCSPAIVAEFAKITNHLRFLYVYPLLETNKRIRLSQFSSGRSNALRDAGNGGNKESWHQLDAYFPFDPYQLPISKKWVTDDYLEWKGVPGLYDEEEEDEESEDEDEEEDVDVEEGDTATDDE